MKRKILVADDEPLMIMLISDFLSSDYEIITAKDGREALNTFREHGDISLAILDIMMPFLNGLEVLNEIKKESSIPIILLTAKNTEMDELTGLISGADEYIKKPFSPSILKARVDIIIKRIYPNINPQIKSCGELSIDLKKSVINCCQIELDLSLTEYNLL
ncbi:MAG: response regulator, partial [Acidaminobacteraceae bacterium]